MALTKLLKARVHPLLYRIVVEHARALNRRLADHVRSSLWMAHGVAPNRAAEYDQEEPYMGEERESDEEKE